MDLISYQIFYKSEPDWLTQEAKNKKVVSLIIFLNPNPFSVKEEFSRYQGKSLATRLLSLILLSGFYPFS